MMRRALFLLPIYLLGTSLGCSGDDAQTSTPDADYGDGPTTFRPDDGVDTGTADTGAADTGSTDAAIDGNTDATTDSTGETATDAATDAASDAAASPSSARIHE